MSRVAYFDCASGASGDMILGALVDLGLPIEWLREELGKLPLEGYSLAAHRVDRSGILAIKFDVAVSSDGRHGGGHGHSHGGGHGHGGHPHRGLAEIGDLLERSALPPRTKERCAALFRRLAEAEGAVHGVPPEAVHFHEVGAVDSIVDIVGAVLGLEWLGVDRFVASPLNVGTGTVTMSHGSFAVPPPATVALVRNVPIFGAGEGELLTPTGALLVTSYASEYGGLPPMRVETTGVGAGTRETRGRPNVFRILVGEEGSSSGEETILVLEAEIDDMSPQLFPPLVKGLLASGALDAYLTPVLMKKARPGFLVTVLAPEERREALEEVLFRETTTLGVRRQVSRRTALERESHSLETPYGTIRVKVGRRGGLVYNVQPEFDDCERAASAFGVPVKEVLAAALSAHRLKGK